MALTAFRCIRPPSLMAAVGATPQMCGQDKIEGGAFTRGIWQNLSDSMLLAWKARGYFDADYPEHRRSCVERR